MTRSRLDRRASAREATAKGSTGDGVVRAILLTLGWAQVVRLSRTNPGCDLVAVCGCIDKHLLWVEVKTYPFAKIDSESWDHLTAFAREVSSRHREGFALFTYQKVPHRPKKGEGASWWASFGDIVASSHQPFISNKRAFAPSCGGPHPKGVIKSPPAHFGPDVTSTMGATTGATNPGGG